VPLREHIVTIELKLHRFICQRCGKMFRQTPIGMDLKRSMTIRCVEWIRQQSLCAPFSHVAEDTGCSEKVVREIAYEHIKELERNYRPSMPHWLGINESYLDGRIEEPLCLLIDLENRKLIEILPNCRLDTLVSRLSSFDDASQLRGVCMDLCEKYRMAVKRVFPAAQIGIDKFQVLRWANKAVDRVRLHIGKLHPSERNLDDWKPCQALLRKRGHSLSSHDRKMLNCYLFRHPEIATAYYLKEEFSNIYNCGSRSDAIAALEKWEQSVPESMRRAFKELLKVLTDWRNEILTYFVNEKTLAHTEAINGQIQDAFRAGERYSFEILRGKLLFGGQAPRSRSRRRAA
ncbi:MAG: ISL3 family transposase, partial [Terracidiphilus sp.]